MEKLFYVNHHQNCLNYQNGPCPVIEEKLLQKGQICEIRPSVHVIIFVVEGEILYSMGDAKKYLVQSKHALFFPANQGTSCEALSEARLNVVRLYDKIQFCDCFHLESLYRLQKQEDTMEERPFLLEVNTALEKYLELLSINYRAGLRCVYYNKLKVQELMYIFRAFYNKEDLARFFAPALSADTNFSQFIMSNFTKYNNLTELAVAMNYTVSGFEKKFRKVFATSPNKWIRKQKAQLAYHQIKTSDMGFKQIADMFGFSSTAAFYQFIKQHFGLAPGEIRKNSKKGEIE